MIPERRYFIHVGGFSGDTSHIMIDGAGAYWICYKGNKPATCEPGAGLDVALRYVQQGVWKEITREEAIMNTSPKTVVLKPEEIKVGMTIIGHSNTSSYGDRSYIGSTYLVKEVQLPFIFATEDGTWGRILPGPRTIDTRIYHFMERAGSKPIVNWEEKAKVWEENYNDLMEVQNRLVAEKTKTVALVQKWVRNTFANLAEVARLTVELAKANKEVAKLAHIKKMVEDPNVVHIAIKLK